MKRTGSHPSDSSDNLNNSQLAVSAALFPPVAATAADSALLSDELIQKWFKKPFFRLITQSTETPEQITALLNHPDIQARFLKHSDGKNFIHILAINRHDCCDAILASTICEKSSEIKVLVSNEKATTHHQCDIYQTTASLSTMKH